MKMQPSIPLLKVGEIDPATNERVTYVTEFDEEASKALQKQSMLLLLPLFIMAGICVPCIFIIPIMMYASSKSAIKRTAQGTMNYLTDHNFVTIRGSMSGNRLIIQLTNIASVTERPAVSRLLPDAIDVNLKPTAPPVTLHDMRTGPQGHTTAYSYQSHSIPLYNVKNRQAFAEAMMSRITP